MCVFIGVDPDLLGVVLQTLVRCLVHDSLDCIGELDWVGGLGGKGSAHMK